MRKSIPSWTTGRIPGGVLVWRSVHQELDHDATTVMSRRRSRPLGIDVAAALGRQSFLRSLLMSRPPQLKSKDIYSIEEDSPHLFQLRHPHHSLNLRQFISSPAANVSPSPTAAVCLSSVATVPLALGVRVNKIAPDRQAARLVVWPASEFPASTADEQPPAPEIPASTADEQPPAPEIPAFAADKQPPSPEIPAFAAGVQLPETASAPPETASAPPETSSAPPETSAGRPAGPPGPAAPPVSAPSELPASAAAGAPPGPPEPAAVGAPPGQPRLKLSLLHRRPPRLKLCLLRRRPPQHKLFLLRRRPPRLKLRLLRRRPPDLPREVHLLCRGRPPEGFSV
ncbi:putative protein FAM47C [Poecilia reticulata]|uniref:putative protein FAM47C n=1 Tax=Poecilia reticulata TaxID=8081 RepID=UPI0007E93632|nr:PREDICTED: putative protein FAM47C [Poecilia reticulata]